MANELRRIKDEAWKLVAHPTASKLEVLEALKLIAACSGVLLADLSETFLSPKQTAQLRAAKRELAQKALRRKERKKIANRKQYLKHKIRHLESQETNENDQRIAG